jgi:hypothetical protein
MKTRKQKLEGPNLHRFVRAAVENFDEKTRRFDLSFASDDVTVLRSSWFDGPWLETLGLDDGEIDLSRLNSGSAPFLWNHDDYSRSANIGVVEKAWTKSGRGYATVRLSQRADVDSIAQDIQSGILQNVSCGYQVQERTLMKEVDDGPSEYRVTRWLPLEISLVSIPADDTVGVGRSNPNDANTRFTITDLHEDTMEKTPGQSAENTTTRAAGTPAAGDDTSQTTVRPSVSDNTEGGERKVPTNAPAVETRKGDAAESQRITTEAIRAERERVSAIRALSAEHELGEDFVTKHVDSGADINAARAAALSELNTRTKSGQRPAHIEMGTEQRQKRATQIENWLLSRAGERVDGKPIDLNGNEFRGATLLDIAVDCLTRAGEPVRGFDRMEIAKRAITHSTSDFPVLLGNVFNKVLLNAYGIIPDTWRLFCKVGSVSDFRQALRYRAGTFGDLAVIPEGGEYTYGTIPDGEKNPIQAKTYGKMFSVTRQLLINDDLGALTDILGLMGRGAARTLEKAVYSLIGQNSGNGPTMADGGVLFNSTAVTSAGGHANLLASGGTAPTIAAISAMQQAMMTQSYGGDYIDVPPTIFLGPVDLAAIAQDLNDSQYDPADNKFQKPNRVRGLFKTIVGTPRLTGTKWYMFADPNVEPVLEVDFLNGQQTPYTEQREGWNVDGIEYKIRHDFGVAAVGFRGARANPGA